MGKYLEVYISKPCTINLDEKGFEIGEPVNISFDLSESELSFRYENLSEKEIKSKFKYFDEKGLSYHIGTFEAFHSDGKSKYLMVSIPEDLLVTIKKH